MADGGRSQPARVLFVARRIGLGGMTRQLCESAIGFADRGIETTVLAPESRGLEGYSDRFASSGVVVERAGKLARSTIMPVLRRCRPEVVRLVSGTFPPNVALASRLMGEGLAVVETLHAMAMRERVGVVRLFDEGLSPGRRYRAVALSEPMAVECLRRVPGLRPWLRVVSYGMPMPDFSGIGERSAAGGGRAFRVLTAARLVEDHKDTATLLRAFALLAARTDGAVDVGGWAGSELLIAGGGRDRAMLESLAGELGISGRVRFLGWVEDVRALMRSADVFVLSTKSESFGRVNIEAAAAGTPVVASRVLGCEASVRDGVNGLLVAPGDAEALCGALERLRSDGGLRGRLGVAGPGFAAEFSMEKHVDGVLRVARELLWKRW